MSFWRRMASTRASGWTILIRPLAAMTSRLGRAADSSATEKADHTLRIATGLVELAPGQVISTTLGNDKFPGPLLRFEEGKRVTVDICNDTDTPELVHWHGQMIPTDVDGAAEEGSPYVAPHSMRRIAFTPKPSGFRFYHTHVLAGGDLDRGTYTGQVGPVYIEPKNNPGAYDREVFLVLMEFEPSFSRGGDMAMDFLAGEPIHELQQIGKAVDDEAKDKTKGFEVGYRLFSINGKMLGYGEPIRVRQGDGRPRGRQPPERDGHDQAGSPIEVIRAFLKLGLTCFGGPSGHDVFQSCSPS